MSQALIAILLVIIVPHWRIYDSSNFICFIYKENLIVSRSIDSFILTSHYALISSNTIICYNLKDSNTIHSSQKKYITITNFFTHIYTLLSKEYSTHALNNSSLQYYCLITSLLLLNYCGRECLF